MLNKSKGDMYSWVDYTWNPIRGKCPHDCSYCYMKRFPQKELDLHEDCLRDDLGSGNTIFIGSSTDMFAKEVEDHLILLVLEMLQNFPSNTYIFQSKNPKKMLRFLSGFETEYDIILGTTLETNRENNISKAPQPSERAKAMAEYHGHKFVTIEPIMDFDLIPFVEMIRRIAPEFVNIGADSGNNNLPEPPKDMIGKLIEELNKFTSVRIKDNLRRLLK